MVSWFGNILIKTEEVDMARPVEWTEGRMAIARLLYLELLKMGKTEREIDTVEDVPSHQYRNKWLNDLTFLEQCYHAREIGATRILESAEEKQDLAYQMALDEAASPQLVSIVSEISKHARWKAAKYNKRMYGDKQAVELSGPEGGAIPVLNVFEAPKAE